MLQWLKNRALGIYRTIRPQNQNEIHQAVDKEPFIESSAAVDNDIESPHVALEIEPPVVATPVTPSGASPQQVIAGLTRLVLSAENKPRIAKASALTILGTGFNFLSPYLFGETMRLLSSDDESLTIAGVELSRATLISLLVSSYSLAQILPKVRDQLLIQVSENTTLDMITQTTEHMLKKSLNYHVSNSFSDIIFLIQKGFTVGQIGRPILTQILPTLFEIIVACTVLSNRYGPNMGIGIAALLTTYTVYSAATTKPIINSRKISLEAANKAWSTFDSALARFKTIHDFGKLKETMNDVHSTMKKSINANVHASNIPINISYGHVFMSRVSMLLALLFVGTNIKSGLFTVEDMIVLLSYLNLLSDLLPGFGEAINQLFASYPDLKFVFGELLKPDEIIDLHPNNPLILDSEQPPSIEFEHVSFSYPAKKGKKERVLFEDLTFKIRPGEKVALVSESGGGKTSIFNLLFGYYVPSKGVIKINGQDISQLSLKSVQANIGLIGQTPNLFKGTVRENILFGAANPSAISDEMIWDMARSANLEEFLKTLNTGKVVDEDRNSDDDNEEIPENVLDMDVGENGKRVSGGQQQKLAILRGLFKTCTIRLFDEITAPFDSESATKVMQSMDDACEGKTALFITHKLTEVKYVDRVIMIEKGRVIAEGKPEELLATCPSYQKLWQAYISQNTGTNSSATSSTQAMMCQLGAKQAEALSEQSGDNYEFKLLSKAKPQPRQIRRDDDDEDTLSVCSSTELN